MDPFINPELVQLLSTDIFKKMLNNDLFQIAQFNLLITLLIKAGIPFDIRFSPETRRNSASASISIIINPTTTLEFVINFESGQSIFDINR
ncbi:hypothetical protein [Alkaliphilus oremlandii]|uniref:Uncharacterized protein n=1 Tax=Alkaliphilus oremlandii (strain OhILAs) TaxID=350688 RepID=A8MGZ6_ALKOO|nr:hypothetical protein [Alkaliphilus oremlandii]ABW18883.1 hypothetical protein Clos_1338 [Alkaliphilus oremlandii OhILAs]